MTKIKICGLYREQDIAFVNEALPDYAGFIIDYPKSHRSIGMARAKILREMLRPEIRAVCVFVDQPIERAAEAADRLRADVIQLHGQEDDGYISELKERTGLTIWKAFRIREAADLTAAVRCRADAVLLDNGRGTGESFDWSQAAAFRRPFILAGGLTPETIPEAIRSLRPAVVDISSGVETERVKDRKMILAAVGAAHRG